MPEVPHAALLNREGSAGIVSKHYAPQLNLLTQMVNFASNLIPRAYNSSPKLLPDLLICYSLLKQFASMLDAMEVLIRAGAVQASFVPGRAALEVSFYLEWILVSDTEKKALYYYVGNIRSERIWGLRVQGSTTESIDFESDLGDVATDVLAGRPALDGVGKQQVSDVDRILAQPEFAAIDRDFSEYKSKSRRKHEPEWYKVLGKSNLKAIARELKRLPEYTIYYSKGSKVTHSQSYKDHLSIKSTGVGASPIRNVQDVHTAFNLAFTIGIQVFQRVLGFYRRDELLQFSRMYVEEWRQPLTNILQVNIVN